MHFSLIGPSGDSSIFNTIFKNNESYNHVYQDLYEKLMSTKEHAQKKYHSTFQTLKALVQNPKTALYTTGDLVRKTKFYPCKVISDS